MATPERVPEMKFCDPHKPAPPTAREIERNRTAATRFSLAGKNAIVTGGARGLGLVVARGFLDHGCEHIALFDMDETEGLEARDTLRAEFGSRGPEDIVFRKIDVTDERSLNEVIREVCELFGGVHVLATFAGIVNAVAAVDYTAEEFREILEVNTIGTFLTTQAVGREMIKRGTGGSIILVASMAGHIVNCPQTHVAYGTSKAGVRHMMHCLAAEWACHGIRVNSLSPGYMNTRLNTGEILTDVLPTWHRRTPMGRIGEREEIVGPCVLMASPAGSFMTGTDIVVDGGYTLF